MNVVFIAPTPPPINGNSLGAKVFLDELKKDNTIHVISLSKPSLKSGIGSWARIKQIVRIVFSVYKAQKNADLIYLTLAESRAGNIRDLLVYLVCFAKNRNMVIHMLGGAGMKKILSRHGFMFMVNKFFISRLGAVVVEGWPQAQTFEKVISKRKIHIIPNFAEEFLFASDDEVLARYKSTSPLKILFLSNLLFGKGHYELLNGYMQLPEEIKQNVNLTFVGGFESEGEKQKFLSKIKNVEGIVYYGAFISGNEKRAMYLDSHIFCLPTYYPYEGQPISIIESYATGCVAMVTMHSGIPQIFEDGKNGYVVQRQSIDSITKTITEIWKNREDLKTIGIYNNKIAKQKYRIDKYNSALMKLANLIANKECI